MSGLPNLSDPCRSASGWLDTLGRHVGVSVWAHTPLDFLEGFSPQARAFVVALHAARVAVEDFRLARTTDSPTGAKEEAWAVVERCYSVAREASHHAAPFHGCPLGLV